MPPLGMWLRIFLLPSVAPILLTFLCLRWISRHKLRGEMKFEDQRVFLSAEGKLAVVGLAVAAVALISSSALGLSLGAPTCIALSSQWLLWHGETGTFR